MKKAAITVSGIIVGHLGGIYAVWLAYGTDMQHGHDLAYFGIAGAVLGGVICGLFID